MTTTALPIDDSEHRHIVNSVLSRIVLRSEVYKAMAQLTDTVPVGSYSDGWHLSSWQVEGDTPAQKRAYALRWLRHQAGVLRRLARLLDLDPTLEKFSDDYAFGVKLVVHSNDEYDHQLTIKASVDAGLTCELVETGEYTVQPAVEAIPERLVPVTEKVCPPSIFAGIEQEV